GGRGGSARMARNTGQLGGAGPRGGGGVGGERGRGRAGGRGLMTFRIRPSSSPCPPADTMPTAASDQPFSSGPQPNLKVVYSTQLVYSTNCARPLHATTATNFPAPFSCASPRSELTGLADARWNFLRRSSGSDSGSTK